MEAKGYIRTPLDCEIKTVDAEKRVIEGYASTKFIDRVKDVVLPTAFEKSLPEFLKGSHPLLFNHNPNEPVGKIVGAKIDDTGLFVRAEIGKDYGRADDVWKMIQDGVLKAFSIGFIIKKTEEKDDEPNVRYITELDLLEISIVSVPANKEALFTVAEGKAIEIKMVDSVDSPISNEGATKDDVDDADKKKASGKLDWPLADRSRPWSKRAAGKRIRKWASKDGSGDIDKLSWSKFRSVHFWYDENNPELVTSYKLLFCDVIDGKVYAIPRAIFACAVVIQGGRGGLDIPEKDKAAVKKRVASYYHKMDMQAPWEREGKGLTFEEMEAFMDWLIDEKVAEFQDDLEAVKHEIKSIVDKLSDIETKLGSELDANNSSNDDEELNIDEIKELIANSLKEILKKEGK